MILIKLPAALHLGAKAALLQRPVSPVTPEKVLCRPDCHCEQPLQAVSCCAPPGCVPAGPLHGPLRHIHTATARGCSVLFTFGK